MLSNKKSHKNGTSFRLKKRFFVLLGALVAGLIVLLLVIFVGCASGPNNKKNLSLTKSATTTPTPTKTQKPTPTPSTKIPTTQATQAPPSPIPTAQPGNNNPGAGNANAQTAKAKADIQTSSSTSVVVNKKRPYNPREYAPNDLVQLGGGMSLRAEAAQAVKEMINAALSEGINLAVISSYRSYAYQQQLYSNYVAKDGAMAADTYSARPGYSEHQSGLAADFDDGAGCALEECFATTAAGTWLKTNASKYGFILRYEKDKTQITGYIFEPWHYRYIGKDLATEYASSGYSSLEEFFNLEPAPTY